LPIKICIAKSKKKTTTPVAAANTSSSNGFKNITTSLLFSLYLILAGREEIRGVKKG